MRGRSASDSIASTRDAVTLRYSMPAGDVDALLDPGHLDDVRKPGVFEDQIRLGVILPPAETMREASAETRAIVSAWFSDVNTRGGIFGRAIALAFIDPSGTPSEVAAAVRAFLDGTPLFALVCSFSEGTERELAELAEEKEIPFIATITSNPRSSSAPGRYLRELFAGLSEQSRALIRVATEEEPETKRIAIVSAARSRTDIRDAAWREARAGRYASVETIDAETLNPATLRDRGINTILLLDDGALDRLLSELESPRWTPTLLAPSSIADPDLLAHAPVRSLVSFPMLPSDCTESSNAMYIRLITEHRIATTHRATQTAALASASLATDALTRAGRNLTRDALLDAIDATRALRTGFAPPLTFRPDRHIGSTGCHIVAFEPGHPPKAAWVEIG